MNFQLDPDADLNGTSMAARLPEVTLSSMIACFGPSENAYYDCERGYEGHEWPFSDEDGNTFNVFVRWGSFRLGARHDAPVWDFRCWLEAQLGGLSNPKTV